LTPRVVVDAWRRITRRQIAITFLLGLGLCLSRSFFSLFGDSDEAIRFLVGSFVASEIDAFALLLAVVAADRATGRDPNRRGAYALAVLAGAAAAVALNITVGTIAFGLLLQWDPMTLPQAEELVNHFWETVLPGGAVVWVINDHRRAAFARARMHGAELERIAAEKRSIESDLQAMQARVEPQFLFNTLAQVKVLYEHDAPLGQRMIDELIAYLRAAMPKMRDTSSTVGQEIELARAYLAIVKVRLGEGFAYEIEASPVTAEARMPPMMLLPLLDHALATVPTDSRAVRALRIRAWIADGRVRLAVTGDGDGFAPIGGGEAIAGIRERLATLYGQDATLLLQQRGGGDAVFDLPLETAAPTPDAAGAADAHSASRATTSAISARTTFQRSPDALPALPAPGPMPRAQWFTGLTWKGIGLVALVCLVNGLRKSGLDALDVWLIDTLRLTFAWGVVIAAPMVLAMVATYNLAPRTPPLLRYASLAVAFLLSSLVGFAAGVAVDVTLDPPKSCGSAAACLESLRLTEIMAGWLRWSPLYALFTVVFMYLRTADESDARAREAEAARARFVHRMEEARLHMLQAQIEPHFLFNALANVRRLYQTDPANGATMLDNLMRYFEIALPQMRATDSTLGREASLTESYLGIQKIRMGPRLAFDIAIPASLREARLPPMMLVTLAENAIKHGLAPLPEGGIVNVSAAASDGQLQVRIADSGQGFTKSSGGGTGLANIRARLVGMYGQDARLALSANVPSGIVATIAVPLSMSSIAGVA